MGSTYSIHYLPTSKANFPRMFGAGVRSCAFSDGFIHKTAAATSHRVARDLRDPPRLIYADSVGRRFGRRRPVAPLWLNFCAFSLDYLMVR